MVLGGRPAYHRIEQGRSSAAHWRGGVTKRDGERLIATDQQEVLPSFFSILFYDSIILGFGNFIVKPFSDFWINDITHSSMKGL